MPFVYPSEIPGMLESIRKDGVKWRIAPKIIVKWDDTGWCIYDDYNYKVEMATGSLGECIVWARTNKEIIPEIKQIMEEEGW